MCNFATALARLSWSFLPSRVKKHSWVNQFQSSLNSGNVLKAMAIHSAPDEPSVFANGAEQYPHAGKMQQGKRDAMQRLEAAMLTLSLEMRAVRNQVARMNDRIVKLEDA
jgi:hypothetical protein